MSAAWPSERHLLQSFADWQTNNSFSTKPLTITRVGNSAGGILPKEVLAYLGREIGDTLTMIDAPNDIRLVASEPELGRQMMAACEMMRRRQAPKELAT